MKSLFRGHIRFTEAEFKDLWQTAHFSFDTNVLLNAYRLNKAAADAFLGVLKNLKGRVWLTYQVADEFFRHYDKEVQAQFATYQHVGEYLDGLATGFAGKFSRHPHIPMEQFKTRLSTLATELKVELEKVKKEHKDPTYNDPTLQLFIDLFDGNVRAKPTEDELNKWREDADARYAKEIPPGFADAKKKDDRKYGDAILWFQLLEYATKEKKPLIFVTDDSKDDWLLRVGQKTLGPLPALIQEMFEQSGVLFYTYPMSRFVEEATKVSGKTATEAVIKEIETVEQERTSALTPSAEMDFRPGSRPSRHKDRAHDEIWAGLRSRAVFGAQRADGVLKRVDNLIRCVPPLSQPERKLLIAEISQLLNGPMWASLRSTIARIEESSPAPLSKDWLRASQLVPTLRDYVRRRNERSHELSQL